MPRNSGNTRKRRHDTNLTFKQLCARAGINPKQRIVIMRALQNMELQTNTIEEVDITD